MIVIDPIGNHTGGKDTNAEGDTREAIQGLNPLADELDCMVFGVRHLRQRLKPRRSRIRTRLHRVR